MNSLFPALYFIMFVLCIGLGALGFINRKNQDFKAYFTHASIGIVGRQTYFWLGDKTAPIDSDES